MSRPPSRPPVESVELHFDAEGDARVRDLWRLVEEAGCASLARNDYNTPHVTLAATPHTGGLLASLVPRIRDVAAGMVGLPVTFTGVALFPHARSVLYAAVLPTAELIDGHARVHALIATAGVAPTPTSLPGAWTPHCTLAKRVRAEQLTEGLAAMLGVQWPIRAKVARVVRWDGAERFVETIVE